MLSYDSVIVNCSYCGNELEFRSQGGKCEYKKYQRMSVPAEVALELIKEPIRVKCKCGRVFGVASPVPNVEIHLQEF